MMKILYVISDSNVGGAGVLLCNLLRHIDRREFHCGVALPFGSDLRGRLLALKVPLWELHYPCDRIDTRSVNELISVIRESGADLIHANAAVSARLAGRLCGKKVLHTRHCTFPVVERGLLRRWTENAGNRLLSDLVIATSESAAENLCDLGIPRKKIRVILNGSDPVRQVDDGELAALRSAWGLSDSDFCVGLCARLEPCKGHDVFIRAAEQLAFMDDAPRNFKFLIVGEGSQRARLENNIRALGLSDFVRMVGFVHDMAPVYRLLRINVNCSCGTETSCLAISEGMSASLPTVATDFGGNPSMIGSDASGILVPVNDPSALASAILRIASDEVLEFSMRRAALSRYHSLFTASRMTRLVEAVYREV